MTESIQTRLYRLPWRDHHEFIDLLKRGQLSEDIAHLILDAGEISRDCRIMTTLLAFTVGFLHMTSTGIPVAEVIRMAKNQNCRINLSWTPNRWKSEHDKFAPAETLRRMSADNVTYDVSEYQRSLPPHFDGYLIKTSRRLGMEGLRQRHSVTSYDTHIRAGTCAIATLFIDKQRWTVTLELTKTDDAPPRITQIRTRYNDQPSAEIWQQVHAMLDIALTPRIDKPTTIDPAQHLYLQNLQRLLPVLRNLALDDVSILFDANSEGLEVYDIQFSPTDKLEVIPYVEVLANDPQISDGQPTTLMTTKTLSLWDAMQHIAQDYIEANDIDFYNGVGGSGTLSIDTDPAAVAVTIKTRTNIPLNEVSERRDIHTGELLK